MLITVFKPERYTHLLGADSPLVTLLRGMAPSAVDSELRAMEIVNLESEVDEDEVRDVGLLLDFITHELAAKRNFELIQALLNVALKVRVTRLSFKIRFNLTLR
jgi:hypothetical protein